MPNSRIALLDDSLKRYFDDKKVNEQFFNLYIKDKPEPLQQLAHILATHQFENQLALNQFKAWASITKTLWRKAKFDVIENPQSACIEQLQAQFADKRYKFGDLLSKADALVMGQHYEVEEEETRNASDLI